MKITRLTRSEFNVILHEATAEQREAHRAAYKAKLKERARQRNILKLRAKMDAKREAAGLPPRNWETPDV